MNTNRGAGANRATDAPWTAALAVVERLRDAQNQHDLESFVACFAEDYHSEQPAHPARTFRGRDQVRENWAAVFRDLPNFHAELLATAAGEGGDDGRDSAVATGGTAWAEWSWTATHADGSPFHWRGVTLFGVRGGRIAWARLYMEPVEESGPAIAETVRRMTASD